jgi:hypothetical protein
MFSFRKEKLIFWMDCRASKKHAMNNTSVGSHKTICFISLGWLSTCVKLVFLFAFCITCLELSSSFLAFLHPFFLSLSRNFLKLHVLSEKYRYLPHKKLGLLGG